MAVTFGPLKPCGVIALPERSICLGLGARVGVDDDLVTCGLERGTPEIALSASLRHTLSEAVPPSGKTIGLRDPEGAGRYAGIPATTAGIWVSWLDMR